MDSKFLEKCKRIFELLELYQTAQYEGDVGELSKEFFAFSLLARAVVLNYISPNEKLISTIERIEPEFHALMTELLDEEDLDFESESEPDSDYSSVKDNPAINHSGNTESTHIEQVIDPFPGRFDAFKSASSVALGEVEIDESFSELIRVGILHQTFWPSLALYKEAKFRYSRSLSWESDARNEEFFINVAGVHFNQMPTQDENINYDSLFNPYPSPAWLKLIPTIESLKFDIDAFPDELRMMSQGGWNLDMAAAIAIYTEFDFFEIMPKFTLNLLPEVLWDMDLLDSDAEVSPEKAAPISWHLISDLQKIRIFDFLLLHFKSGVDGECQYAEHFLSCIALLEQKSDTFKATLGSLNSSLISQALNAP